MQLAPRVNSPQFRLRWRGYDRAEVDEFLKRTAADRQRLHEDLAQLEAIMAARRGPQPSEPGPAPAAAAQAEQPAREAAQPAPALPQRASGGWRSLLISVVAVVVLPVLIVASLYVVRGGDTSAADAAASHDGSKAVAAEASAASPAAPAVDSLQITLTARGPCWVRTAVDGGEPVERLLRLNDTILVRAKDELVLRVGDAGALSVLINSQPAKSLGAPGEVVTTRITRTNYSNFLSGN